MPLKLYPQPFLVLQLLVEHAGQVVTREEIRKALWGDNIFVDFDRGINFAVNQIRAALSDDPEAPRYVETVPRRGYRFIAPVTSDRPGPTVGGTGVAAAKPARNWKAISLVAIIVGAGVVVAGLFWRSRQARRLTDKDTIVLADFTNTTGDPVFDGTLRQGLSSQLEQSPFLNLLSDTRIAQTLALMAQPKDSAAHPGAGARGMPADGQRGHHRRLDREPWQPVRAGPQGGELPQRRPAGRRAGDGQRQGEGAPGAGRGRDDDAREAGRVAGLGSRNMTRRRRT